MSHRPRRTAAAFTLVAGLCAVCLTAPLAGACGPFFPSTILDDADRSVLAAPVGDFYVELSRIAPVEPAPPTRAAQRSPASQSSKQPPRLRSLEAPAFRAVVPKGSPIDQTAVADLADLKAALAEQEQKQGQKQDIELSTPQRDAMLAQYAAARDAIRKYAREMAQWEQESRWRPADSPPAKARPSPAQVVPPAGLPDEFALYLTGAAAYHQGNLDQAADVWQRLLKLPEAQRRRRSTWAAFMLGKACLEARPAEAARWFAQVRDLAKAGLADTLGLAAASYGWQARAELDQRHYARAAELYLLHQASGDPTAAMSLRTVAQRVLADNAEAMKAAAAHGLARQVVTAYLVAQRGPRQAGGWLQGQAAGQAKAWLSAVEVAGAADVRGADRLAWAAYQGGDMAAAARWLDRAPGDAPVALWIRAKLLLRDGKLDDAAAALAKVVKAFPPDELWSGLAIDNEVDADGFSPADRAAGELAALRLARRHYVDALDLLLRAGFWVDAAYVAERILTPDELTAYVDRAWPEPRPASGDTATPWRPVGRRSGYEERRDAGWIARNIRHLLARRLARLGLWQEARPYFPADLRSEFDEYIGAIRASREGKLLLAERARSLWKAAKLARREGMELLGTEIDPDGHVYSGDFQVGGAAKVRPEGADPNQGKVVPIDPDERRRLAEHRPAIDKRFHYRYIAADHAWNAARMMPDESDETARVLWEAGTWLKARDPQAADRFYKALVRRCGTTDLGRQAAAIRWFPELPG